MALVTHLPDLQTLDVRVEHRIACVSVDNGPINLMDATLLGELDRLVVWLANQGDNIRVVVLQSAIPDFFLRALARPGTRRLRAGAGTARPSAALIRPDGVLAWAATPFASPDTTCLKTALHNWFGPPQPGADDDA